MQNKSIATDSFASIARKNVKYSEQITSRKVSSHLKVTQTYTLQQVGRRFDSQARSLFVEFACPLLGLAVSTTLSGGMENGQTDVFPSSSQKITKNNLSQTIIKYLLV